MRTIKMAQGDVKDRIQRRAYALWDEGAGPRGGRRALAPGRGRGDRRRDPPRSGSGTPGAGVHICQACAGTGRRGRGRCKQCGGTGRLIDAPEP
jgi:hypothetical protein